MDPNVDSDSKQEARDFVAATTSSPFGALAAVEPKPMGYEEWRAQVRSVYGRYSPEGADPKTFLLHRRALLNMQQPISQIAYASGFSGYTHFARQFRRRFGHPPGAHGRD
jgi:hypothetical protein